MHGTRPNSFVKKSQISRSFRHTRNSLGLSRTSRIIGFVCTFVNWLWIDTNNWLEIRKLNLPEHNIENQNLFVDKILEMLKIQSLARSSGSAHCLFARWKRLLLGSSISVSSSSSHPFLIRHDTHRFTHYRRYYRQCCAYPHAWLKPVAVNLSFVFFCSVYYAPPLHHTIEASLRQGVRGVDALRILQTGTMDREWCRIYERESRS